MIDAALLGRLRDQADTDGITQLVVGAVICDAERVLLLQRPDDDFMGGIFELPSGKVDPGEALDAALIREVKEETGLDTAELVAYIDHFDYTSGSGKQSRQFNFTVTVTATDPITLTEHDTYTWIGITEQLPVTVAVENTLASYRATQNA